MEKLTQESLTVDQLRLYPEEYQYRLGMAKSGEVESHAIKDEAWDPLKHGAKPLLVHKRKDKNGAWEYAVVDGHHRANFAKRLVAEGKLPKDFMIDCYVLEEEKGWNVATAKIAAAFADGAFQRGADDVLQEAVAIKESRENPAVKKEFLPSLQMDKGNLHMALTLSGLSKTSLEKVASGDVPVEAAAMVAERVKDDAAKQDRVIGIISAKLKQDYPNYQPNTGLAATLAPKANDNQRSWVERTNATRGAARVLGF